MKGEDRVIIPFRTEFSFLLGYFSLLLVYTKMRGFFPVAESLLVGFIMHIVPCILCCYIWKHFYYIHPFFFFFSPGHGIQPIDNVFSISLLPLNFVLYLFFQSQMKILTDIVPMTNARKFHWQSPSSLLSLCLLFRQYIIILPFFHHYLHSAAKLVVVQVISFQLT